MSRVQRHLLLCATPSRPQCCDPGVGAASWNRLKELLRERGLEASDRPEGVVLRTKADCLRICRGGPILMIWPEGIVYGGVTPERIDRIVQEHLIDGKPIEGWIVERMMGFVSDPSRTGRSTEAQSESSIMQP